MKVYVTKYALTEGIFPIQAELVDDGKYVSQTDNKPGHLRLFLGRSDYALTIKDAQVQAKDKLKRKVASMKKQLRKFETMSFDDIKE